MADRLYSWTQIDDLRKRMFSKTAKMGCLSWSLNALEHCPEAYTPQGELVPACASCYATFGNYLFKTVKNKRTANDKDWREPDWVERMVTVLKFERHLRWFDSGDVYDALLAEKIYKVISQTPNCKHWLPTRMHKSPAFLVFLTRIRELPNAVVRLSSDSILGELPQITWPTVSTIVHPKQPTPNGAFRCPSPQQGGQCRECRACWSKNASVIAYEGHGMRYVKQHRLAMERINLLDITDAE